jgi:archaetidylinositol phosphate synthase
MLYARRRKLDNHDAKIGKFFAKLSIAPNYWTFASIILAFLTFYALVNQSFAVAAVFFALTAFFDVIDGAVARELKKTSKKGAYFDTMTDRYAEFIVIVGLLFAGMPSVLLPFEFWLFLYLFGSIMTTYSKAAAKEKDLVGKEIAGGVLERSERMLLLFIGFLLAGTAGKIYLSYIIIIIAVLSNITVFQRARKALR